MVWTIIQIALAVAILFLVLGRPITSTFLLSADTQFKIVLFVVFPYMLAVASIILGVFYLIIESSYNQMRLTALLYVPIALLSYFHIKSYLYNQKEQNNHKKEFAQEREIEKWITSFGFINKRDVSKNYHRKNGVLSGTLHIWVTKDKIGIIEGRKHELNPKIKLTLVERSEKEQDWYNQVRNWIKEIETMNVKKIEDYTHYYEQEGVHLGTIYILTDPENFEKIQQKSIELPKGIELKMYKHAHMYSNICSFNEYSKKYLESAHSGEFLVLKTS